MRKNTAKIAFTYAQELQHNGELPMFLGIPGLLALIYDAICRHRDTMNHDEVMKVAALSLAALEVSMQVDGVQKFESPESNSLHAEEDCLETLDEAFPGWREDNLVTVAMTQTLKDVDQWSKIPETVKALIEHQTNAKKDSQEESCSEPDPEEEA